jgi:hypothetical protein
MARKGDVTITFTEDHKELMKGMKALNNHKVWNNKIARPSIRTPMKDKMFPAVQSSAPVKSGAGLRSISLKPSRYNRKKERYSYYVSASKWYLKFVELGTKERNTKSPLVYYTREFGFKFGKYRGKIETEGILAGRFMRKAFKRKERSVERDMELNLKMNLDRQLRKYKIGDWAGT